MAEARRKVLVGAAIAVTAMFFVATFAYGYIDSGGWYVQSVEDGDTRNNAVAIAVDDSDSIHVVFHGMEDRRWAVRHAVRDGGDWLVSTVGAASDFIYGLEVSFDAQSRVHVTWCDAEKGFSYAYATSYGFEVISVEIDDFTTGAMAIDTDGVVHGLCTVQRLNTTWPSHWEWEFQYWVVSAQEWVLTGVFDPPANTSSHSVFALLALEEGDPQAMISYQWDLTGTLFHALATVTDSGLDIGDPFLSRSDYSVHDVEMDSQGGVHLAGRSYEPGSMIEHRYHDGQNWVRELVDYAGDSSWMRADVLIDGSDTVYLTYLQRYFALDHSQLKVARKTGGTWDFKSLETGGAYSYDRPALAVDAGDDYHVALFVYDGENKNVLTYANQESGEVLVEEVRSAVLWTALMAVIVFPSALAASRWRAQRRQRKERLERLGLYPDQLK